MRRPFLPRGLAALLFGPLLFGPPFFGLLLPDSPLAGLSVARAQTPPSSAAVADNPPSQPQAGGPLTLDAALAMAAAGSFPLSAATREVQASEGAIMQAGTRPNPELALTMEDTRRATRETTGQINLPVELGGKRAARLDAAQRGRDVAAAQLASTRAELRASVISAFFAVLIAQERVRLATGSADIATRAADVAARRVAAGKVSPVDETRARVEQANAALEVAEANAELMTARHALAALWGDVTPRFGEAAGDLDALPARPAVDVLGRALDDGPALAASRLEVERRHALVGVERSRQYPDITVSLGARRDNDANRNMAVLGVAIPLPLFDRNQGNLYEAMRRADKAEDEYQAQRVRLMQALQQAATQLEVSRASAQTLRATVLPAAQRAYEAATRGFEAGKFGFLDVLDAQRTLFQARIRHLGAMARAYDAASQIDRILGR